MMNFPLRLVFIFCIIQTSLVLSENNSRSLENIDEIPKCLSFITRARDACVPIEKFVKENGYESKEKIIKVRGKNRNIPSKRSEITWSSIVIVMIMHNTPTINPLLSAHFNTWLRRVGEGLDVVFVTDEDDTRELPDIVPKGVSKATFHLYKSNAEFDGKHIRFKVIDAYDYVSKLFHKDQNKKYYFKMDTDTYLLGENLIGYLNELDVVANELPIHVGKLMCSHPDVCHSGGAFYGMNKKGFELTSKYLQDHPDIIEFNQEGSHFRNKGMKLMQHEDFMVSYAFKKATNVPGLHQAEFNQNPYVRDGLLDVNSPPITYHQLKRPELVYAHEDFFYGQNSEADTPMRSYADLEYSWKNDNHKMKYSGSTGWILLQ